MELFLFGVVGAICLELIKFYELSGNLTDTRFRKLLRSPRVWSAVLALLVASGLTAWAVHADEEHTKLLHVFITGAAARSVLRQLISARLSQRGLTLGNEPLAEKQLLSDVFS